MAEPGEPVLYLASRSPRRRDLLAQIGIVYTVLDVAIDETAWCGEAPREQAQLIARAKAEAGWAAPARTRGLPVLAADTLIECDGQVYGKPLQPEVALATLARLAGREHQVHSAVAVCRDGRCESALSSTRVRMRASTPRQRAAYVATGEPLDKAGAYALQGLGAVLVESIHGSFSGVVGLALCDTAKLLQSFGIDVLE